MDYNELIGRQTEFLSVGGLFNPGETASVNPEQTTRLVLDSRNALQELGQENSRLVLENNQVTLDNTTLREIVARQAHDIEALTTPSTIEVPPQSNG